MDHIDEVGKRRHKGSCSDVFGFSWREGGLFLRGTDGDVKRGEYGKRRESLQNLAIIGIREYIQGLFSAIDR